MTLPLARFRDLLDAYGAEPLRWPDAERDAALALLETSAEARAALDAEARFDALLDAGPALAPSPALAARILAAAPQARLTPGERLKAFWDDLFPSVPVWKPAAGLALAAALGAWAPAAALPALGLSAGTIATAESETAEIGPDGLFLPDYGFDEDNA
jgi:hypothetical protein